MTGRWGSDRRPFNRANTPDSAASVPPRPDVAEQLRQLDCDPIAGMAMLAQDEALPAALRARMYAELASYVAPRRKAVELTGPAGGPIETQDALDLDALSTEELLTLKHLLKKAALRRTDGQ